mmetsp:Transcript_9339/g.22944  ORF Transcript_9339/g.22944 Transcript_9339/m.22944 type:complete len:238 (+) Transcript_9339:2013-2726(+)
MEELFQERGVFFLFRGVWVPDRGFAELALGDLVREVGAHQDVAPVAHLARDQIRAKLDFPRLRVNLDAALDQRNRHRVFECLFPSVECLEDRGAGPRDELVGHAPDEHVGGAHRVLQVRVGVDRFRQLHARQVLHVEPGLVDHLGEFFLLASVNFDRLLEDVHVHLGVEQLWIAFHILPDDGRDGRAPVATADQCNLVLLFLVRPMVHAVDFGLVGLGDDGLGSHGGLRSHHGAIVI